MVHNLADETQVKEHGKKAKLRRDQEIKDVQWILGTIQGRRFIWRLLGITGLFRTSFAGDDSRTNFNEGRRDIGLRILEDINESKPEAYLQMTQEAQLSEVNDA